MTDSVAAVSSSIINGDDNRKEVFEFNDPKLQHLITHSIVALITRPNAKNIVEKHTASLPILGKSRYLCASERFFDQPSAAYCSGVLLDWDLVLTAQHCLNKFPLEDIEVVFGYYYLDSGHHLDVSPDDVYRVSEVVASDAALDYAWIRLERSVNHGRAPAAVYTRAPELSEHDPIVVVSSTSGLPLKVDNGGSIFDARQSEKDYFIASTDTFDGSSGGGAFDSRLGLTGILSSGGPDYVPTDENCLTLAHAGTDGGMPEEQYTYANIAVAGLCDASDSALCDSECDQPCTVPARTSAPSCAVPRELGTRSRVSWWFWVASALAIARTRTLSRSSFRQTGRRDCGVPVSPARASGA